MKLQNNQIQKIMDAQSLLGILLIYTTLSITILFMN